MIRLLIPRLNSGMAYSLYARTRVNESVVSYSGSSRAAQSELGYGDVSVAYSTRMEM